MSTRHSLLLFVWVLQLNAQCVSHEGFGKVDKLLYARQYDAASRVLSTLKPCALSPLERFQLGWLYGRARNFTAALEAFNSVPPEVPDLVTHNYAVALSSFELSDYGAAVEALKTIHSQPAFDSKCENLLAVSYSKLGRFQDALAILTEDLRDHPDDLTADLNMITVYAETGDIPQAAALASQISEHFPQSPDVHVVDGAANILLGRLDSAKTAFKKAVDVAPSAPEPRFFLALTEYKLGHYTQAAQILRQAIGAPIADSDLHYLLAECLLRITPLDRARVMTELNRAILLNAKSACAHTLRGKLQLDAGQAKEALSDLQLATELDPTSRSAVYNLARAYRAVGRDAEAKLLFERLRSEPGDTLTELGNQRLNQALKQGSTGKIP